jgi:hypothetical protein
MNTVHLEIPPGSWLPAQLGVQGASPLSSNKPGGAVCPMLRKFEMDPGRERETAYLAALGSPVAFVRVPSLHSVAVAVPDPDPGNGGRFKKVTATTSDYIVAGDNGALSVWPSSAFDQVFKVGVCPLVPMPSMGASVKLPEPLARLVSLLEARPKMDVSQADYLRTSLEKARKDSGDLLSGLKDALSGKQPAGIAIANFPSAVVGKMHPGFGFRAELSLDCRMGLIDFVGVKGLPPELPALLKEVLGLARMKDTEVGLGSTLPMGHRMRERMCLLGVSVVKPEIATGVNRLRSEKPAVDAGSRQMAFS